MRRYFIIISAAALSFISAIDLSYSQPNKTMKAHLSEGTVRLDGHLTEKIWSDTEPVEDFMQKEPSEGASPTQRTELRVIYDNTNIYIGVKCFDTEPEKIIRNEMKLDGALPADDSFWVAFDTYSDSRSAYAFMVNPNGARLDTMIKGLNTTDNNWNGVWDASAAVTLDGWTAEMVIPLKTLRFPNKKEQTWRINFGRNIRRNSEEVLWTGWLQNDGMTQLARYGVLEGIMVEQAKQKGEFKPYILGGGERINSTDKTNGKFNYGLDLRYGVTSNLTLDVTTLTDFAQVEVDREQVNLTQLNTQYDEKRDFFVEGAEIFSFCPTERRIQTFNTRSIGLTPSREQLDVLAGAKLTGKIGDYQIGIMDIYTDKFNGIPSTNYSAARVKRNILETSYVGLIATNKSNSDKMHQAYGFDFQHFTGSFLGKYNLDVNGYLSATFQSAGDSLPPNTRNTSGKLRINMPNDQWEFNWLYRWADENFIPEMGYIYLNGGIKKVQCDLDITPRSSLPFIKKWLFTPLHYEYDADLDGHPVLRVNRFTLFGFITSGQDEVRIGMNENYQYFEEDFPIFRGTIVPKGTYQWWDWQTSINTSQARPLSVSLQSRFGNYYDGSRKNASMTLLYKGNQYFALSADMDYNDVYFESGRSFESQNYGGRFILNLSTRLSSSTLLQWNNSTGEVSMNFRLHYIPVIGSDIYFVYNHLWNEDDQFATLENRGILKANWMWRF